MFKKDKTDSNKFNYELRKYPNKSIMFRTSWNRFEQIQICFKFIKTGLNKMKQVWTS